ncbi:glycosyltransferase family 4 protein [Mucilaginibacter achroorhodeus]|uniref:Glycosyltransferase family 4 protein n=2 Tax=Mucilaginibacter achroorhodeus TaxID=2599294 RepID=A0A563U2V2_9SPHI|nr:glycosyltransferase family 4 protein [Mucilaginibacter achroorhodeus]
MINHSGIGTYLRMLLPAIISKFEVTLLGDPSLLGSYYPNVAVVDFPASIYSISEQLKYRKVIPVCDLFWSPHYNAPLMPVKALKRVVTIHDVFHLAFASQLSLKQKIYAKLAFNLVSKLSNRIVTVSHFSKQEILKFIKVDQSKINVIHNGVEQQAKLVDVNNLKAKYQLPDNYILFVGNVKPHKNLKNLANAYLALPKALQDRYKLLVVGKKDGFITGDDNLFDMISSNQALSDNLHFTGYVDNDDMATIYNNAAVFVFPSLYEGFGLPPLEAMVNKCAVLASEIPVLHEVCGEAAVYFDPENAEDIASKIEWILNNDQERETLIAKGAERVKLFDWQQSAQKHIELFNQLIYNTK